MRSVRSWCVQSPQVDRGDNKQGPKCILVYRNNDTVTSSKSYVIFRITSGIVIITSQGILIVEWLCPTLGCPLWYQLFLSFYITFCSSGSEEIVLQWHITLLTRNRQSISKADHSHTKLAYVYVKIINIICSWRHAQWLKWQKQLESHIVCPTKHDKCSSQFGVHFFSWGIILRCLTDQKYTKGISRTHQHL